MARITDGESRRNVFEAAWHYSVGMTVDQIHEATGRARPTIYRALEKAREYKWLDDTPRLTMPRGEERTELEQYVADLNRANEVRDLFGRDARPVEVIVVPSPPRQPSENLESAVCTMMRQSDTYRDMCLASPDRGKEYLEALINEALATRAVIEAGGDRPSVEELVTEHVKRPYTDRDFEASKRVGRATAERFCRAVEEGKAQLVGLSWGYHVASFVHRTLFDYPAYGSGRGEHATREEAIRNLRIFPLIGSLALDPVLDTYEAASSCGAWANCVKLAAQIGAPPPLALTQPAYVPPAFHRPEALRQIWKYVQEDESIQKVFGEGLADRRLTEDGEPLPDPAEHVLEGRDPNTSNGGYIGQADVLVTGLGTASSDSRAPRLGLLSSKELAQVSAAGSVGDVSGFFYWDPTAPPTEKHKQTIRRINSRIIGPRLYDFIRGNQRGRDHGTLGTVVLARGAAKARSVRALCFWRAVTTLICDSDLAEELIRGA